MSFKDFFSRQARKPSGLFGRFFMALVFDKGNFALNERMKELVDPQEGDHIFEIGFGTGGVICDLADQLDNGVVEGIDFSDAMLAAARRRNKSHIRAGKVRLHHGDFDSFSCEGGGFSSICSANTIYFWADPEAVLKKAFHMLRPGGKVVLAYVGKEKMDTMDLASEVFTSVSPEQVEEFLRTAGAGEVRTHDAGKKGSGMHCTVALKKGNPQV